MPDNVSEVLAVQENAPPELDLVSYETELIRMDQVYTKTQTIRDTLTEKLSTAVNCIDFESLPNGRASEIMAKMSIVTSFMQNLDATEKNSIQRVNTKLRRKDAENTQNVAAIVAEYLSKIPNPNAPQAAAAVESAVSIDDTYRKMVEDRKDEVGDIPETALRESYEELD